MDAVIDFYKQYDEDTRLTIRHKTEFFVTTYFLDNIIKGKDYILDMAAGTGIYAQYYARRGCRVEAMDIVPEHIEKLTGRISADQNINAGIGDARDLSLLASGMFDVVLNMGVIYHIDKNEIPDCLSESLRVLRPGGYLALAYINKYPDIENDNTYGDIFKFYKPSDMENYFSDRPVKIIEHVPTDGELHLRFEEYLNQFSDGNHIQEDGFLSYQQSLSRIEDYHFWFEENFT